MAMMKEVADMKELIYEWICLLRTSHRRPSVWNSGTLWKDLEILTFSHNGCFLCAKYGLITLINRLGHLMQKCSSWRTKKDTVLNFKNLQWFPILRSIVYRKSKLFWKRSILKVLWPLFYEHASSTLYAYSRKIVADCVMVFGLFY